jgi:cytochrome c553
LRAEQRLIGVTQKSVHPMSTCNARSPHQFRTDHARPAYYSTHYIVNFKLSENRLKSANIAIILFTGFAFGLPIWAMQANDYDGLDTNGCSGECYEQWKTKTGGVIALADAKTAAKAAASPAELGKMAYTSCIACHGAGGQGGVGPQLVGQAAAVISEKLYKYKAGETIGPQSALMWGQSAQLSDTDVENLAAYIASL